MSIPFNVLFLFRSLVLYVLGVQFFLYFREFLDLWFYSVSFILAIGTVLWVHAVKLRKSIGLIAVFSFPWILKGLFSLLFISLLKESPDPASDLLFFLFDRNFFPSLILYYGVAVLSFLYLLFPSFRFWETGLHGLLLAFLFWSQANYELTLYNHPLQLAVVTAVVVLLDVAVLFYLSRLRGPSGSTKERVNFKNLFLYLVVIVPLLIVMVVFIMGRYTEGALSKGGGLIKPTLFQFDFSDYITLESEIALSNDLVLFYKKMSDNDRYLLRRFVLSGYDPGRGFFQQDAPGEKSPETSVPDYIKILEPQTYEGRIEALQEFYLVNLEPSSLVALNEPTRIIPMKNWAGSSFKRIYRTESVVPTFYPFELFSLDFENNSMTQEAFEFYTDYGEDQEIMALAEKIVEKVPDYYAKVFAIENYLKSRYFYSLRPGIATDGNQLHHFLFNSQKGYCSYFAFSMALLCRAVGIPARVSVGFFLADDTGILNIFPVRADQAHAWVEVYFQEYGWLEFDPTSQNMAEGEEYPFNFTFGTDETITLLEEILNNTAEPVDKTEPDIDEEETVRQNVFRNSFRFLVHYWYILLPVLYFLFVPGKRIAQLLKVLILRDRRKKVRTMFVFVLELLYGVGIVRTGEKSLFEYCRDLEEKRKIKVLKIYHFFEKAEFGHFFDDSDVRNAFEGLREFVRSYWKELNVFVAVIGFFNPVSSVEKKI